MNSFKLKLFLNLVVHFLVFVSVTAQDDLCGQATADPTKTCISVRLPWRTKPIYFCIEKGNFRYRNQCHRRFSSMCGRRDMKKNTLLIGTPWDCCPLVSNPDTCANQKCPPPPHNRTCETIEPDSNKIHECCNSYFCEKNVTSEVCYMKRLEPECNVPPKEKTNCVAFEDPYGCCPKFHCDEDSRPGYCPAELEAKKFMARFNTTTDTSSPVSNSMSEPEDDVGGGASDMMADAEIAPAASLRMSKMSSHASFDYIHNGNHDIQCVGDFNCPGKMKCCSSDMNVYLQDGLYYFKDTSPTDGHCMEPKKDEENKKNP